MGRPRMLKLERATTGSIEFHPHVKLVRRTDRQSSHLIGQAKTGQIEPIHLSETEHALYARIPKKLRK